MPLDFKQWYFFGVGCVEDLAIDISRSELLNFGEMSDEEVVDPIYDLVSGCVVTTVIHSLVLII